MLGLGCYIFYLSVNQGLAPNAKLQQFLRFIVGSCIAIIPLCITNTNIFQYPLVLILIISIMWIITYPLAFHLTHKRTSPDYDNHMDIAFGIYLFGWLTGIIIIPYAYLFIGILMFLLLFITMAQWVYYAMYKTVINDTGIKALQETSYNEVIEFIKSYSTFKVITLFIAIVITAVACIVIPINNKISTGNISWWQYLIVSITTLFTTYYIWKPCHGIFVRTGIIQLYTIVKEYIEKNNLYIKEQQTRLEKLDAKFKTVLTTPHTILMVIGESASRDFMSVFKKQDVNTTPWMSSLAEDKEHCIIFPNAYSCDIQTVPTLEKVLTEFNQYEESSFYTSCSIVDMAQKLGYTVHWYSNQGHLGAADTPITLVANTSNTAKWTKQELNKIQYDENLLDFLVELDPKKNNFLVLHLKGNHFNYENRFPEHMRKWTTKDKHDKITNYKNSIHYTDSVLKSFYEYCIQRLNLQAMVYVSDHADVPDRHRQPNFGGFRDIRIPLMVWISDEYKNKRPNIFSALYNNKNQYWTNDLTYELICGLMDVESNHFHEENSLASIKYRFSRQDLTSMNGKIKIADDQYDN